MKYLITVVISLLAVQAFADTKAHASLKNGGEIVLTNESCPEPAAFVETRVATNMQRAYWYDDEGNTEDGCWKYDDRTIYFAWNNGGESRYPKKKFKISNNW
jgi:hypothetical protein